MPEKPAIRSAVSENFGELKTGHLGRWQNGVSEEWRRWDLAYRVPLEVLLAAEDQQQELISIADFAVSEMQRTGVFERLAAAFRE